MSVRRRRDAATGAWRWRAPTTVLACRATRYCLTGLPASLRVRQGTCTLRTRMGQHCGQRFQRVDWFCFHSICRANFVGPISLIVDLRERYCPGVYDWDGNKQRSRTSSGWRTGVYSVLNEGSRSTGNINRLEDLKSTLQSSSDSQASLSSNNGRHLPRYNFCWDSFALSLLLFSSCWSPRHPFLFHFLIVSSLFIPPTLL